MPHHPRPGIAPLATDRQLLRESLKATGFPQAWSAGRCPPGGGRYGHWPAVGPRVVTGDVSKRVGCCRRGQIDQDRGDQYRENTAGCWPVQRELRPLGMRLWPTRREPSTQRQEVAQGGRTVDANASVSQPKPTVPVLQALLSKKNNIRLSGSAVRPLRKEPSILRPDGFHGPIGPVLGMVPPEAADSIVRPLERGDRLDLSRFPDWRNR